MDKLIINGGKRLIGEVSVSGAKNAVLPIMAATIINPGQYQLSNVPELRDTLTMMKLLKTIGAKIVFNNNKLSIDTRFCNSYVAPYELVKTMRASFYLLGPLMSRFQCAHVSLPGGCAWGPRPVDFHIQALKKLGANVKLENGMIITEGKLKGNDIAFEISSVGATGNTIMAAVKAEGLTKITNAAREPEIDSLCDFLIKMGAKIKGIGTSELMIEGTEEFNSDIDYNIIPDRIEAGTFLIATCITNGDVILNNVNPKHLTIVIDYLKKTGMSINVDKNTIHASGNRRIKPINMDTDAYPAFPTDLQAQWMALMTKADGPSVITENIYEDRFTHIAELRRFGARIHLKKNMALLNGSDKLKAAPVMSTDIRASASLIIAALSAKGKSAISRVYHIDRGYENIEQKLSKLGADIHREED